MVHFNPGDKVVLIGLHPGHTEYLYEVVGHFPKNNVHIYRAHENQSWYLSVKSEDLIPVEEEGWVSVPDSIGVINTDWQIYSDGAWHRNLAPVRNRYLFPIRRRISGS